MEPTQVKMEVAEPLGSSSAEAPAAEAPAANSADDLSSTATTAQEKKKPGVFKLAYGFIQLAEPFAQGAAAASHQPATETATAQLEGSGKDISPAAPPTATQEEAPVDVVAAAAKAATTPKAGRGQAFLFYNHNLNEPIKLYGNQVTRLIKQLPVAYHAVKNGSPDYCYALVDTKRSRITLETSLFKERHYLFLKKYFRVTWPTMQITEEQDKWIPTKSALCFNPAQDDPDAILNFVLSAVRR